MSNQNADIWIDPETGDWIYRLVNIESACDVQNGQHWLIRIWPRRWRCICLQKEIQSYMERGLRESGGIISNVH